MEFLFKNKKDFGVYVIKNIIDDRVYIGSTIDSFYKRFHTHRSQLKYNNHGNQHLQNFVNKYGIETLIFEPLLVLDDKNLVRVEEQKFINLYENTFNICNYVDSYKEVKQSEETKKLKSNSIRQLWGTDEYRGKQMRVFSSDEFKEKMRIINNEILSRVEVKDKISKKSKSWFSKPENKSKHKLSMQGKVGKKLTEADVMVIKYLLKFGITQSKISEFFNVNRMSILRIKNNKTWTYVEIDDSLENKEQIKGKIFDIIEGATVGYKELIKQIEAIEL